MGKVEDKIFHKFQVLGMNGDLWDRACRIGSEFGKGVSVQSFAGPDMPCYSLKTISVKESVKDGEICNLTTVGKKLERFGKVEIVDEINDF